MREYNFSEFEPKWQKIWEEEKTFAASNTEKDNDKTEENGTNSLS